MPPTLDTPFDLVLLSSPPGEGSGDRISVMRDLERIRITDSGAIVQFLRSSQNGDESVGPVVMRSRRDIAFSVGRHLIHSAPSARELRRALPSSPETVYISDTTLYPAVRKAYPRAHIVVRAQNSFALLEPRISALAYRESVKLRLIVLRLVRVERRMMRDEQCTVACVSAADKDAFSQLGDRASVSVEPITSSPKTHSAPLPSRRLAYLGGMTGHKVGGMRHFLATDFPSIREANLGIRLDLWGSGTELFEGDGFIGHGRWNGPEALPLGGDALYINPDYLGGGVKQKVGTYLHRSVPFITTDRGAEGFVIPDSDAIIVADVTDWPARIASYFG